MAALDSFTLLLFFFAIRSTSVAIGMFLQFMAPVWVALVAPRFFHAPTDPVVYPALADRAGRARRRSLRRLSWAAVCDCRPPASPPASAAGVGYAGFQLVVKDLTRRVASVTIVLAETMLDALIVLPLALWQLTHGHTRT